MIDELDEVLRQLMIREIPIKNSEVEIKFDQPSREWSARLSRPSLNLFLYDVRENQKLRQAQPAWEIERNSDGSVSKRRKPVRMDLHYMITAWAAEPEDEHRLLTRALLALFRFPHLPEDLLPASLQNQHVPISIMPAQYDDLRNPTDVWNVLDNEMRPAIACIITLALDPYQPIIAPLVRIRDLRFLEPGLGEQAEVDRFWTIGGTVHTDRPLEDLRLTLVERDQGVSLQPDGRFVIGRLREGDYTLEVAVKGRKPRRHKITVPAPDYELEV
jgi:hypothetical protein